MGKRGKKRPESGKFHGWFHAVVPVACAFLLCFMVMPANAAFNNTTQRGTFAGHINYVATGGTLRTSADPTEGGANACAVGTTSTNTLSGIPSGSTIVAAYLYWGGSGATVDSQVTFNGNNIFADATFTDNFTGGGTYNMTFSGGFKDVTSLVSGNGSYTFSGLTVQTTDGGAGETYCTQQAVTAGWSLIVVYDNANELTHVINIYDGLQSFWGSQITTTPANFRIPPSNIDGKTTVVTWEGDIGNSGVRNGYYEKMTLNGGDLTDSCNPSQNLYNSTINNSTVAPVGCSGTGTSTNSWGVDIDTFDFSTNIVAGDEQASLDYSSGADLVLLAAQVISTTNTPIADLGITKSHSQSFFAGQNASFSLDVHNYGPDDAKDYYGTYTGTTITDTLPTGLDYVSANGTGWTCGVAGSPQVVTCTNPSDVLAGADLPTVTLTVKPTGAAGTSVTNTASVSNGTFDNISSNNSDSDTASISQPNLSTSTKSVIDVNGGDAEPGDVLEYTITLKESAGIAAPGASVSDALAAHLDPATASMVSSTGCTSATFSGSTLNATGCSVPANGSISIVFDVNVRNDGSVIPGDTIDNSATITNPNGPGATPAAAQVTIAQSQLGASGNKLLYVYDDSSMTRTPQLGAGTPVSIDSTDGAGGRITTHDWVLTPALQDPLTFTASTTVSVNLLVQCNGINGQGNCQGGNKLDFTAGIFDSLSGVVGAQIGTTSGSASFNFATITPVTANIAIGGTDVTVPSGHAIVLRIANTTSGISNNNNRPVQVEQYDSGNRSAVTLTTSTVVNVDSVNGYIVAYPGITTPPAGFFSVGNTVYIRAAIRDPFGAADVSSARLSLIDSNGNNVISNVDMGAAVNSSGAIGTFEYAYNIPVGAANGFWTATVTGYEGTEGTITHTANGSFGVGVSALSVAKSHTGNFTAGANGSYSLVVHNNTQSAISGPTTVTDTLATGLTFVSAIGSGWDCSASSGQNVSCTNPASIPANSSLQTITLTVAVAGSIGGTVDNVAAVANPYVNGGATQPGNTDTATVDHPNLSTSTKAVLDVNGGDAAPGDVLEYTITLSETGGTAASSISVSDTLSSSLDATTASIVSSIGCSSAAFTGDTLTASGCSVPANGSITIVFDVEIAAAAIAGTTIDNTATVTNPTGPGATPAAEQVVVSQSQVPASGNKLLYVYDVSSLTRTPQTAPGGAAVSVASQDGTHDWTLGAPLAKPLTLVANSTVSVNLMVKCSNPNANNNGCRSANNLFFTATLYDNTAATQIGSVSAPASFNHFNTYAQETANITIGGADVTIPVGHVLILRITNTTTNNNRPLLVEQYDGGNRSVVSLNTSTVVNVDSVNTYSAAYPSVTTTSFYIHDEHVYVRALISDPFGGGDVGSATLTVTDPNGVTKLTAAAMTPKGVVSGATRTFEYDYTVPNDAAIGFWTASVTAVEGSEGTVTHTANNVFGVGLPALSVAKSHSGNFTAGSNASYSMVVHNNSPNPVNGTTTVTDTLSADLLFVSANGGPDWTCGASGTPQVVTCTNPATINASSSLATITLTVTVKSTAGTSVDNHASVANPNVNGGVVQDGVTDTATILHPNLSTSTKSVLDVNGGDASPGDTLKYTITLTETGGAAATGVSVSDTLPATLDTPAIVSSTGCTSAAFTGNTLNASGCSVPANGSISIVFTAKIAASTTPGTVINNTATVTNPNGPGATPAAPPVTVSQSQVPASGNKLLYLYDNNNLTRTPQTVGGTAVSINSGGSVSDWSLSPVLRRPLTFVAGSTVSANLVVKCSVVAGGACTDGGSLFFTVALYDDTVSVGTQIGTTSAAASFNRSAYAQVTANVAIGATAITVPVGHKLILRMVNTTATGARPLLVEQYSGGLRSNASLNVSTVVNVDSVTAYAVPYSASPNNTTQPIYDSGNTVYLRAVISDPFGSYDVSSAKITITDAGGTTRVSNANMVQVADSLVATRTFEYAYTVPSGGGIGFWQASVTGYEGSEGTVTHTAIGTFSVGAPDLLLVKAVTTISNPLEGTTNAKAIPGATMQYLINVSNTGAGHADANSIAVTDMIPANTRFVVGSIVFTDGTPSCELTVGAGDIAYSNTAGGTWTYTPVADGSGTDPAVDHVRITPQGVMAGQTGVSAPNFNITFRVIIN